MKSTNCFPRTLIARLVAGAFSNASHSARTILPALLSLTLLSSATVLAQNIWTGAAGTMNWTTSGNWSLGAIPNSGDTVLFDNVVPGVAAAVIDNIVDDNFT